VPPQVVADPPPRLLRGTVYNAAGEFLAGVPVCLGEARTAVCVSGAQGAFEFAANGVNWPAPLVAEGAGYSPVTSTLLAGPLGNDDWNDDGSADDGGGQAVPLVLVAARSVRMVGQTLDEWETPAGYADLTLDTAPALADFPWAQRSRACCGSRAAAAGTLFSRTFQPCPQLC
jgi:hypothetical protein